jgi:hypothetical protein
VDAPYISLVLQPFCLHKILRFEIMLVRQRAQQAPKVQKSKKKMKKNKSWSRITNSAGSASCAQLICNSLSLIPLITLPLR